MNFIKRFKAAWEIVKSPSLSAALVGSAIVRESEKKARWIERKSDGFAIAETCSNCGFSVAHNINRPELKYCPMCGAKMLNAGRYEDDQTN